jgi:hypothetical protein
MFLRYTELLNALDSGATTKITINNRRLNKADFEQATLIPMAEDNLDKYHKEYNNMLLDKATGANSDCGKVSCTRFQKSCTRPHFICQLRVSYVLVTVKILCDFVLPHRKFKI